MLSIFTLRFYTQGVIIGQEAKYTFPKLLSHANTNPYAIIHLGVLFEKHIYEEVFIARRQNEIVLVLYFIIPRSGDDLFPIMN